MKDPEFNAKAQRRKDATQRSRRQTQTSSTQRCLGRRRPQNLFINHGWTRMDPARQSRNQRSAAVSERPAAAGPSKVRPGMVLVRIRQWTCCGWCSAHSRAPILCQASEELHDSGADQGETRILSAIICSIRVWHCAACFPIRVNPCPSVVKYLSFLCVFASLR
jgi:hypothetical protein